MLVSQSKQSYNLLQECPSLWGNFPRYCLKLGITITACDTCTVNPKDYNATIVALLLI